ncbi:YdbL family protein [Sphingorhabdus sp.]|uniref:YdbL family protein n=1 Tax=Sphingorhabdus sp. TaxID=1902408 RepID=UPI0037C9AB9D
MALQPDGYLGFVIAPAPMVRALVEDSNIKRKAAYSKEALTNGATVEEMALRSGCRLIAERTVAGEKYQTPSGQWKTREGSAPELDPRCP